jgi:hypothetical protein
MPATSRGRVMYVRKNGRIARFVMLELQEEEEGFKLAMRIFQQHVFGKGPKAGMMA